MHEKTWKKISTGVLGGRPRGEGGACTKDMEKDKY